MTKQIIQKKFLNLTSTMMLKFLTLHGLLVRCFSDENFVANVCRL